MLGLSEYRPTAWFGGLLALTMAVAFLAEIFVLPATIKLMPGLFSTESLRARDRARRRARGESGGRVFRPGRSRQVSAWLLSAILLALPERASRGLAAACAGLLNREALRNRRTRFDARRRPAAKGCL